MRASKTAKLQRSHTNSADPKEQQSSSPAVCCEEIRQRAYYNWEVAGCPCGDGVEFWLQAEAELQREAQAEAEGHAG